MPSKLRRPRRPPANPAGRWTIRITFTNVFAVLVTLVLARPAWAVADIPTVITNLRNWIVGILAGLATLFLTFGGLRYLMAGGDPGEVEAAKRAVRAAAIGYGLALLAPVFVTVLKGLVGADG
ncbi:pilin [Streptomyces sp. NPDC091371]|uniref:pilin n=1 Tax=Streptomyces sp. NPDC091371 TaxID=3155303 RepID=UPI003434EE7B